MKVDKIEVHAGRTFNHPYESYSNLRPGVTMTATLDDSDDPKASVQALQAQAEELVENHKRHLLDSIEQLYRLSETESQLHSLERQITEAQERVKEMRAARDKMQQTDDSKTLPVYTHKV